MSKEGKKQIAAFKNPEPKTAGRCKEAPTTATSEGGLAGHARTPSTACHRHLRAGFGLREEGRRVPPKGSWLKSLHGDVPWPEAEGPVHMLSVRPVPRRSLSSL